MLPLDIETKNLPSLVKTDKCSSNSLSFSRNRCQESTREGRARRRSCRLMWVASRCNPRNADPLRATDLLPVTLDPTCCHPGSTLQRAISAVRAANLASPNNWRQHLRYARPILHP